MLNEGVPGQKPWPTQWTSEWRTNASSLILSSLCALKSQMLSLPASLSIHPFRGHPVDNTRPNRPVSDPPPLQHSPRPTPAASAKCIPDDQISLSGRPQCSTAACPLRLYPTSKGEQGAMLLWATRLARTHSLCMETVLHSTASGGQASCCG